MARKRKMQHTDLGTSEHEKHSNRILKLGYHGNSALARHTTSTNPGLHERIKHAHKMIMGKDGMGGASC